MGTERRDVRIEASDTHAGLVMIGGTLEAQRIALGTPLLLEEATVVNLHDLRLTAEAGPLWGCKAAGIRIDSQASLLLDRAVLEGLRATGLIVNGTLTARNLVVRQTDIDPAGCLGTRSLTSPGLGEVLVATGPSVVAIEGFEFSDAPIGVVVSEGASFSLREGHLNQVGLGMEVYGRKLPDLIHRVSMPGVGELVRLRAP